MTAPLLTHRPRALALSLLAGLSLATVPALAQDTKTDEPPLEGSAEEPKEMTKGEKRLARMLKDRVAGEPQSCIRTFPTDRMTTIDKPAYVFGRGNTIYVQRTSAPNQIRDRDALVLQRFGNATQVCRQDVATTIDPFLGFFTGAVMFEDFIPYTRVSKDDG